MQAYIRFKTPSLALRAILDPECKESPLRRLQMLLPKALREPKNMRTLDRLDHELRLLGCLVRVNIRDRVAQMRKMVDRQPALTDEVARSLGALLDESAAVTHKLRDLKVAFADPSLPPRLAEVFAWTDEYVSLTTETSLAELLDDIDRGALAQPPPWRRRLADTITAEQQYRLACHYPSLLHANDSNEHYVYRQGLLKKFVTSVLFLEIKKEKEGRGVGDFIAALAAGVAMLLSTIGAIWSQSVYGLNSFPFVVALVIGYMFKDRVKEWLKLFLANRITRFIADYDVKIYDPVYDVTVGRCRETFMFLEPQHVPAEVLARRHGDAKGTISSEGQPEVVIKYAKLIRIHNRVIGGHHARLADINDIIRFNVSNFLARADDPIRAVRVYNPTTDAVEQLTCPKVYHINAVFVLRAQDREHATLDRVRVILDKTGIRRLEEVR